MTDAEIAALRLTDPEAWACAIDPAYAERKRVAAIPATPAPAAPAPAPAAIEKDRRPVTFGLLKTFAGLVAKLVREHAAPQTARIAALEKQVRELQELPRMRYMGTWQASRTYAEGNVCTDGGSMHYCNAPTTARPGTDGSWVLCVKRGKDR